MEELGRYLLLLIMAFEFIRLYRRTGAAMEQSHKLEMELLELKNKVVSGRE